MLCEEYFKKIPFTSKHIFKTDGSVHNNLTNCEKCGLPYKKWLDKCLQHFIKKIGEKKKITIISAPRGKNYFFNLYKKLKIKKII